MNVLTIIAIIGLTIYVLADYSYTAMLDSFRTNLKQGDECLYKCQSELIKSTIISSNEVYSIIEYKYYSNLIVIKVSTKSLFPL